MTAHAQQRLRVQIARQQIEALTLSPNTEAYAFWWVEYDRHHAELVRLELKARRGR